MHYTLSKFLVPHVGKRQNYNEAFKVLCAKDNWLKLKGRGICWAQVDFMEIGHNPHIVGKLAMVNLRQSVLSLPAAYQNVPATVEHRVGNQGDSDCECHR